MRKAALVAAGVLTLPLAFSLPAVAQHLMERAQDEGMRQAREAERQQPSRDHVKQAREARDRKGLGVDLNRGTRSATTGAAPSDRMSGSGNAKGAKSGK
jgi:hypothetical protein